MRIATPSAFSVEFLPRDALHAYAERAERLTEKADGVRNPHPEPAEPAQTRSTASSRGIARGGPRARWADDEVGCIVITGTGRRRSPRAADIHEQREDDKSRTQASWTRSAPSAPAAFTRSGACAKPTIGMINGLAYGGAGVLASSLDMRVGCEHASFRFLAAAYGRINTTWTLPNQVGWPIAKELLFSGREVKGGGGAAHRPAQPPGAVRRAPRTRRCGWRR